MATTSANGQITPAAPPIFTPTPLKQEGSAIEAAANKTLANNAAQVALSKALGVGQKGSGRRRRTRGGSNMNVTLTPLPTADSGGATHEDVHIKNVDNLNQLRSNGAGDKLINAQPYHPAKLGGKRTRRRVKHGRRDNRTRCRRRHRHTRTCSRRNRVEV